MDFLAWPHKAKSQAEPRIDVGGSNASDRPQLQATPTHFDVWLRNELIAASASGMPEDTPRRQASFLWPSVGHFATHRSDCEPSLGERQSDWGQSYMQSGTRKRTPEEHHRWVCRFTEKGPPAWLRCVVLPDELPALVFKTLRPPREVAEEDWGASGAEPSAASWPPGVGGPRKRPASAMQEASIARDAALATAEAGYRPQTQR